MGIRDIFRVRFKTFFNPLAWLDYDHLKMQGKTLSSILTTMFNKDVPRGKETFEKAKERLRLSDADLKAMLSRYRFYTALFIVLGLITFTHAFYLLFAHRTFSGCLIGLVVTTLFFAQAFRFDFWGYQIKRGKLGVTFNEWYRSVMGEKER